MTAIEIIEKHTNNNPPLRNILLTHGNSVADFCIHIAQRHPNLPLNTVFLREASLLHDIGVTLCNAPGIYCFGQAPYIAHGYLGSEILQSYNLPLHALVAERHTGAGISLTQITEQNLPLPLRDMLPISLEEQLICYADKFFSKSKLHTIHPIEKIIEQLQRHDTLSASRFLDWHSLFS